MQYTAYYIIRPRPELEQVLGGIDGLEDLLEPELWAHSQGGRTTTTLQDHISVVKLLFVSYIRYLVIPRASTAPDLDLAIDEKAFDRWWTLEVFNGADWSTDFVADDLRTLNRPELGDLLSFFGPFPANDPSVQGQGVDT